MKSILFVIAIVSIIAIDSCKDSHNPAPIPTYTPTPDNYSSMSDFFNKNASPMQTYTISAAAGGSFTTPQGTNVSVGANSFIDIHSNPITSGNITIEFKDIYKKSDMLLNNMPTTYYYTGGPMKSGGEFFIRAMQGNNFLRLTGTNPITIKQPLMGNALDTGMRAMVTVRVGDGWEWGPGLRDTFNHPVDTLSMTLSDYVFNLYQYSPYSQPYDTGSWCNSDNSNYFSAYTQTSLTIVANDSVSTYDTYVFLLFKNLNSMVHVYQGYPNNELFPYLYAPVGLQCTVVAVGVKNGTVYSSFTPITISANQTVNFTLMPTTTDAFKTALKALD